MSRVNLGFGEEGAFTKRLMTILIVSVVWSIWKVIPLQLWSFLFSWNYLLKHLEPAPLIYVLLSYVWVVWAFRILIRRYKSEVSWRNIAVGILSALPFVVALNFIRSMSISVILLTLATFSVFGGVVEEILYRGLLLDILTEKLDVKVAVIIQSLIFGLSHPWSIESVAASFILGIVAAALRLKIGMGSNMAFHWLINAATHV